MEITKENVTLWKTSWFNLLYAMKMNLELLNDTQYYTSFEERPTGSGNYFIKSEAAKINTGNILNEMARQLGMTEGLKEAVKHHRLTQKTVAEQETGMAASKVAKLKI